MNRITAELFTLQDLEYKSFNAKLIPTISPDKIIGIRTPVLRKYARGLDKKAADSFISSLPHNFYEENNLHAFILEGYKDYEKCIALIDRFLPYIDNWATCDSLSPKIFKNNLPKVFEKAKEWIKSEHTYTCRFGIKTLMSFFLENEYAIKALEMVSEIRSEEYYVNMMIAWFFATALAKQYDLTLPYIKDQRLDKWTHNKAIQKAVESYRITDDKKEYLKTLKIR